MHDSLKGKTAFITGSTAGIGKATALHFASLGANVVVTGRGLDAAQLVVDEIKGAGGEALAVAMDVSQPSQVQAAMAATKAKYGGLDYLIGNAAIEQQTIPIEEISIEEFNHVVDIDFKGQWHAAHFGVPLMLGRPGAAIVFISSFWSLQGGPGLSAYSSSKGGVNSLARQLGVELGPRGIRVNAIVCGGVDTPQYQRFTHGSDMTAFMKKNVPLGRVGQPIELARTIRWLCSDDASYITAQLIGVDGGMAAVMTS